MAEFSISDRLVGDRHPTFIIAELSANHRKSFDIAAKTLRAMKKAGADAVKFQTYTPNTITIDSDTEYFKIAHGSLWDGKTLYQLYEEAYTPWEWFSDLSSLARELDMISFSSPFDLSAVEFLEEMGVPAYKVASFEITDIPLIERIASKGKPVLISTGIATLADMEEAAAACRKMGNTRIALLKCSSTYPTDFGELNLKTIPHLRDTFGFTVGLSDHSRGISSAIAAVALGATIVEKHFILDRALGGPDAAFSLMPEEFLAMVKAIREVEQALGRVNYELSAGAMAGRIHCRSLFAVKDIKAREPFTTENVRSIRPGHGLHPRYLNYVLTRRARVDVKRATPIGWPEVD
ncbi:MAG: pseudaminic acid synthase [Nitrospirae bacterium]|nr:pseudaminic acid synthase [Nitrospirota bacterium]